MTKSFWTTGRISGGLLMLSIAVIVAEFIAVLIQGNFEGVPAAWEGVEEIGEATSVFRTIQLFTGPETVLLLLGFGVLTVHLSEAGDRALPFLAFNLFIIYVALSAIETTFHGEVTAWAGEEWARTGAIPQIYEPLREWVNGAVQLRYVIFVHASLALYGWAILRTNVLYRWVGWTTLIWSLVWLALTFVDQTTLPATFILIPLLLGITLLVHPMRPESRPHI